MYQIKIYMKMNYFYLIKIETYINLLIIQDHHKQNDLNRRCI